MAQIRIALCQLNTVVGDIEGNVDRILEAMGQARRAGAHIAVFPELTITGYPPEDLLLKPKFVADNLDALNRIAALSGACVAVIGFVDRSTFDARRGDLYNAAAIVHGGMVVGRYHKRMLPNYGPFDEQRYFKMGQPASTLYSVAGVKVGVSICEDAWFENGPIAQQAAGGAELILNLNASPFFAGRQLGRKAIVTERAIEGNLPIVYVNQVGGQDELVFDGGSMVIGANGALLASAVQFSEEILIVDLDVTVKSIEGLPVLPVRPKKADRVDLLPAVVAEPMDACAEIYSALVLGTADYIKKNGFTDVVIGLSGGVDSSLVAAVATDAIGSAHVHGVMMPSRYSSDGSVTDAQALAHNLEIDASTVPIEAGHSALNSMLKQATGSEVAGLTDENLQSRIRGVTLMALSNEFGWLVLTTGNKSELAVGYSTLYGDTAGGFSVIKDVAKTQVYELCHWRNAAAGRDLIPMAVLTKAPSAELRPGQRDDDSLPPYDVLDPILQAYVENDQTASEIEEKGFDPAVVRRVVRLVDIAEYKRRQSPIGVRVTPKSFGKDRRVPITNQYPG